MVGWKARFICQSYSMVCLKLITYASKESKLKLFDYRMGLSLEGSTKTNSCEVSFSVGSVVKFIFAVIPFECALFFQCSFHAGADGRLFVPLIPPTPETIPACPAVSQTTCFFCGQRNTADVCKDCGWPC